MTDELNETYDVVVIGGGAAGLNGALMLARSRRAVVVLDAGEPRNAPAEGVHGLLARDGTPPAELLDRGRSEVRHYGGQIVSATVAGVVRDGEGFTVMLANGQTLSTRRVLVATGVVDELPDIGGVRERWGRDVIHCPYCHGWEVRDQAIGILATDARVMHQALLFRQLTDDVIVFAHTGPALSADEIELLAARGIEVIAGEVSALEVDDDRLSAVLMRDGRTIRRDALVIATRTHARADFLAPLGLAPVEHPSGFGTYIPADSFGRTDVPGIWFAGNVADMSAQVGAAAAAGALAGAQINADLAEEDARRALAARSDRTSAARV